MKPNLVPKLEGIFKKIGFINFKIGNSLKNTSYVEIFHYLNIEVPNFK